MQPSKIRISISEQTLVLETPDGMAGRYPVSTSKFGTGSEPESYRTPLGRFRICEKIGYRAPQGMIFRSRLPTGEIAGAGMRGDLVLTRILWLEGVDPGNANTRKRFIYIHGTNEESLIGTRASHGCIRMRNADVADLYDRVEAGAEVEICV